jgi:hypothetical protein
MEVINAVPPSSSRVQGSFNDRLKDLERASLVLLREYSDLAQLVPVGSPVRELLEAQAAELMRLTNRHECERFAAVAEAHRRHQ